MKGSIWGNPFHIGKDGTREEVIEKYRQYILSKPELLAQLESLRGKTLGCWCSPQACHGDVLVELLGRSQHGKVYTVGVYSNEALERIDELLREPGTLLIDVRLNAYSMRVNFQEVELRARYRQKYHVAGKYLGNTGKWRSNLIRIANPAVGIQCLARYLGEGHDLILLYQDEQHIGEVCRLLEATRPGIEVVKFVSVIRQSPAS
jgi:hypothetical protein